MSDGNGHVTWRQLLSDVLPGGRVALVEANGGSVRYERAEPRGARMIVTLETASVPG